MQKIQLIEIVNPIKLEIYINANMVDIAYVDKVKNNSISVLLDEQVDINNPEDKIWLDELFKKCFLESEELNVKIIW